MSTRPSPFIISDSPLDILDFLVAGNLSNFESPAQLKSPPTNTIPSLLSASRVGNFLIKCGQSSFGAYTCAYTYGYLYSSNCADHHNIPTLERFSHCFSSQIY